MYVALSERPVKGTTACVCSISEDQKNVLVNKMDGFSKYHNFAYEERGVRVWKAFGKGPGKLFLYDKLQNSHQGQTGLLVKKDFFPFRCSRYCKFTAVSQPDQDAMFECSEPGCRKAFKKFSDLEIHLEVGDHDRKKSSETSYDKLRREWAEKFSTVDTVERDSTPLLKQAGEQLASERESLSVGWALHTTRGGATRFSENVKDYLTAKFDLGERSGLKADPAQVALDMRTARDEGNNRLFGREEWISKTQVQGYFSRLAAKRRRPGREQITPQELLEEEIEQERNDVLHTIEERLSLQHPITYDIFCLCDYVKEDKLSKFNVSMLKVILKFFDVSFHSKDRKKDLVDKLSAFVQGCNCFASSA